MFSCSGNYKILFGTLKDPITLPKLMFLQWTKIMKFWNQKNITKLQRQFCTYLVIISCLDLQI